MYKVVVSVCDLVDMIPLSSAPFLTFTQSATAPPCEQVSGLDRQTSVWIPRSTQRFSVSLNDSPFPF